MTKDGYRDIMWNTFREASRSSPALLRTVDGPAFFFPQGLRRDFCSQCSPRHAFGGLWAQALKQAVRARPLQPSGCVSETAWELGTWSCMSIHIQIPKCFWFFPSCSPWTLSYVLVRHVSSLSPAECYSTSGCLAFVNDVDFPLRKLKQCMSTTCLILQRLTF